MLELHEMKLTAEDNNKLRHLCATKGNCISYKDALALIQVNRDLDSNTKGFWVL